MHIGREYIYMAPVKLRSQGIDAQARTDWKTVEPEQPRWQLYPISTKQERVLTLLASRGWISCSLCFQIP